MMKKYEAPKMCVISRNDVDIVCTSGIELPLMPMGETDEQVEE